MNDAPVARAVPPVADEYHCATPVVQVAPKVTEPVPQVVAGVTVGAFGTTFTVAITGILPDSLEKGNGASLRERYNALPRHTL